MKKLTEGYVAYILNERELVLNIGSKSGVSIGMKFKILSCKPTTIFDPITGKIIGEINREKVRVICTEVHDEFSICSTYRYIHNYQSIARMFEQMSGPSLNKEEIETLRVNSSDKPAPLDEIDSYVRIGDKCVELV